MAHLGHTLTWVTLCLGGASSALAQVESGSVFLGCERANERLVINESSHLDPSCVYTKGVEIRSSNVVFDCQGARIFDEPGGQGRGILIAAPVDVALENVKVRNCTVEGFLNNLRVERTGWKGAIEQGSEYDVTFSDIVIEDSTFIYKNCGENVHYKPDSHWERWYGADGNLIEGNTFIDELDGVWVGSRMAQNQRFMDCSDPAYITLPFIRVHRDYAVDNTLLNNNFVDVERAIRIEDDGAWVEGNLISSEGEGARGIILGTKYRTDALDEPVLDATILNNQVAMPGEDAGFSWIHGHEGTTFEGNYQNGAPASLARGKQPPMTFHLFVESMDLSL